MDTLHRILDLMWKKGLSDIDLCNKAGLNKSAVTDWKKGKTKSYLRHLKKIAEVLEVSEDYLLNENEEPQNGKPPVFVSKVNFLLECEGITRSKFVSDLGFSREIFSQWTKGSVAPSSDDIVRVAKYLDISIDYLMNDEFLLPIQPLNLTDDEYGLLCHYREKDSAEQYSGPLEHYFPSTKKAAPVSEQLSDEALALLEIVKTMTKEEIEQIITLISSLKSKRNP